MIFLSQTLDLGQTSDKKCDSETTNLQLLCDLQAPPIFPAWRATSDRTSCDRPRLTSWDKPGRANTI